MPSEADVDWDRMRDKIIGLGENSYQKSYYPALQKKIADLEQFRALLDESNDAIFLMRADNSRLVDVSGSATRLLGYTRDQFLGMSLYDLIKGDAGYVLRQLFLDKKDRLSLVTRIKDHEGRMIPYEIAVRIVLMNDSFFVVAVARDISERMKIEDDLRRSEETYRALFNSSHDGVVILDKETGAVVDINDAALQLLHLDRTVAGYHDFLADFITGPESKEDELARFQRVEALGPESFEQQVRDSFGQVFWAELTVKFVAILGKGRIMVIIRDVTERHKSDEQIRTSLHEKEVLLKEIHHRVKNNLQVISSLLNIQMQYLKDPDDKEIFRDSQNRIRSMALVHEVMYGSVDLAHIDFSSYLERISKGLYQTHCKDFHKIRLSFDVQPVSLSIDSAVPCGLIVNELITNSLKHAFPGGREGEIIISLRVSGTLITLEIADNGVGMPPGFTIQDTSTLGMQLITMLVEQIDGELSLDSAGGVKFSIRFPSTG